jgi:asparagine synthase (glutamine-hydrolysing)
MCGIAGVIHFNNVKADSAVIQRMTSGMQHRGPDADGFYVHNHVALGHRRLSIIDLSTAANQPLSDSNGRYQIVFNGEIYNFLQVKQELKEYHFNTNGDTEVILAAYDKWGKHALNRINGMFAFAIWDEQKQELLIVRDRMGVKPLYYYRDEKVLVFASEIRAILASQFVPHTLNHTAIKEYFAYQSFSAPDTIIEGIKQLPAGSFLSIKGKSVAQGCYWAITQNQGLLQQHDESSIKKRIRELLTRAVEQRLISDVPIGAFLSGGIDSSVIVGLMAEVSTQRPNTFTVGFEEKNFDESPYASIVAKKFNTIHNHILLKPTAFLDEMHNALQAMDSPSGDGINTYVVSKAIRNSGLTVALSGIGGDELFAGYPIFRQYLQLQRPGKFWKAAMPARYLAAWMLGMKNTNKNSRFQQLLKFNTCSIDKVYPVFRQVLSPVFLRNYLVTDNMNAFTALEHWLNKNSSEISRFPLLSQVSIAEYGGYTQNTLLKDADQMSMAVSLEVREPFFDHELVQFVLSVPDVYKYPVYPKKLLVESLNGLLPHDIVHRKKQGFVLPWDVWMKTELKQFCENAINNISHRDFINGPQLKSLWMQFLKGDKQVRWLDIWLFVVLEHWLQKNYGG